MKPEENMWICDGHLVICETRRQIIGAINRTVNVGANGLIGAAVENKWKKDCQREMKKWNIAFARPFEPIFLLAKEKVAFVKGMAKFEREIWHVIIGEKIGWISPVNWVNFKRLVPEGK